MCPRALRKVLFVDDDPQHLKLYQWVIERGPFTVLPLLVGNGKWELPEEPPDIVALDYRLKGPRTAVEIAKQLRDSYPKTPIVVLSELEWIPDDVTPYSVAFVSKGEPQLLLNTLEKFSGVSSSGAD
jgi:DNA-binding response OmpR family regulator